MKPTRRKRKYIDFYAENCSPCSENNVAPPVIRRYKRRRRIRDDSDELSASQPKRKKATRACRAQKGKASKKPSKRRRSDDPHEVDTRRPLEFIASSSTPSSSPIRRKWRIVAPRAAAQSMLPLPDIPRPAVSAAPSNQRYCSAWRPNFSIALTSAGPRPTKPKASLMIAEQRSDAIPLQLVPLKEHEHRIAVMHQPTSYSASAACAQ